MTPLWDLVLSSVKCRLGQYIILILKITNIIFNLLVPQGLFRFIIILEVDVIENIISSLKRCIMRLKVAK